jgi:hypothetical protein
MTLQATLAQVSIQFSNSLTGWTSSSLIRAAWFETRGVAALLTMRV